MSDVEIRGKVSLDTGASSKSMTELNDEIKATKKALQDAKIGSSEYVAAQKTLAAQTQKLKEVTDGANQSHASVGAAFGMLKDKVTSLVPGLKGAVQGAQSFNLGLKALMANPIVLIIAAIVLGLKFLYDAFTSTREGAEKVEAIFTGVSAAVQVVVDRVMRLGRAVIEFFKGNWKKAAEEAKGAVTGIIDEIGDAYEKAKKLKEQLQGIRKEELADDLDASEREKRLAILSEKMSDETISAREKLKIAKELRDDTIKNAADDLERAKRKTAIEIEQITMKANWEKDHLEEVNQLKIDLNKVETDNALEVIRVNKQVRTAQKQVEAEDKQAADERKARMKELADRQKQIAEEQQKLDEARRKRLNDERKAAERDAAEQQAIADEFIKEQQRIDAAAEKLKFDNERERLTNKKKLAELALIDDPKSSANKIAKIKADLALELQTLAEGDLQRQILEKKASDAIVKIKEDEVEAKKKLDNAEFESKIKTTTAVGGILQSLSSLIGNQTAVGKGLAVAASLIDTYAAIASTIRQAARTPMGGIPGYAIAQGIATGIAGFAAVRNILKVQVPGASAGGGVSAPSIANISAPLSPQASTTALNQSSINGIGNAASGGVNRSFVLDRDIKDHAEREATLTRRARLG